MVELTEDNLISTLMSLKDEQDKNYIKEGWFDGIDMKNLFKDNENKYKTSIIDCINNCTSPSPNKKDFENKEEDFIKEKLKLIFKAFSLFEPSKTKVLILGQDPYTDKEEGKATGLAFLLNREVNKNDSLYYILIAINRNKDFTPKKPNMKEINTWLKESKVLLLNTSLTYDTTSSKSNRISCWKLFITQIIKKIFNNERKNSIEIYLWGGEAQNTFFQLLNEINNKDLIQDIILNEKFPSNRKRNDNKGFKNSVVTDKCSVTVENKNLTIFLSVHPSKLNDINNRKFDYNEQFEDKEYWKVLLERKIYNYE